MGGFGGRKRCISIVDVPKADPSHEGEGRKKQLKQNTNVSKYNVSSTANNSTQEHIAYNTQHTATHSIEQ